MAKLLTIIVPSYNMEAYLPKCLRSLVVDDKELLQKLDVIIVNDGSKDRTSEIAHEFESRYQGVFRVIDKVNGNYGSCINAALTVAKGRYIKVLDADDWFETNNFQFFLSELQNAAEDVILTDFELVDLKGEVIESHRNIINEKIRNISQFSDELCSHLPTPSITYRLALLTKIGYRQTEGIAYTDQEWDYMPMSLASTCRYFPLVIYKYVMGRDGQTCSEEQRLKQVGVEAQIALGIVRFYLKNTELFHQDARHYMKTRMLYRARRIYSYFLLEYRHVLPLQDLMSYDRLIKELDTQIYDEVGEVELSSKLHFHYIREWREKRSRTTFKFLTFLMYVKAMRLVSRLF